MSRHLRAPIEELFDDANALNQSTLEAVGLLAVGDSVELSFIPQAVGETKQVDELNLELVSGIQASMRNGRRDTDKGQTLSLTDELDDGTVLSTSFGTYFEGRGFNKPIPVALTVVKKPLEEGGIPRIIGGQLTRRDQQPPRPVFGGDPDRKARS